MLSPRRLSRVALPVVVIVTGGLLAVDLPAQAAPVSAAASPAAVAASVSTAQANARMAAWLKSRLKNPKLGTDVAIDVWDVKGGRTVFASQAHESQLPASNMKLVTALTALTTMGPEKRLPTRVVAGTNPSAVVIVGGGDALLGSADLQVLAQRTVQTLTAASPTKTKPVALTVSYDESLFANASNAPGWRSNYVPNEVSAVRPLARREKRSSNTSLDAAIYFSAELRAYGIRTSTAPAKVKASGSAKEVARVAGHRVADMVSRMLLVSDNTIAETLYRDSAVAVGRPATWAGGRDAAYTVLRDFRIPLDGVRTFDGSGISRSDGLTAVALIGVLRRLLTSGDSRFASVQGALPIAGRTGTLQASNGRFTTKPSSCARGQVRAKTGTLSGVIALSGITYATDGKPRLFSIVANNVPDSTYSKLDIRRAVDGLAATIRGCW